MLCTASGGTCCPLGPGGTRGSRIDGQRRNSGCVGRSIVEYRNCERRQQWRLGFLEVARLHPGRAVELQFRGFWHRHRGTFSVTAGDPAPTLEGRSVCWLATCQEQLEEMRPSFLDLH